MPTFSFIERMASRPDRQVQIYRLAPPAVNERSLRGFAQRLGLQPHSRYGKWQRDRAALTYFEGDLALKLYRGSGGLCYRDHSRWQADDGISRVEYDDEHAVQIAHRVVDGLELAAKEELQVLRVTRLHVGSVEIATGRSQNRAIDVGVAFQRVIDGVPVDGPGGKIVIYLDHKGELTGFDRIWRAIRDVYRPVEELRPPEHAERLLMRYWKDNNAERIDIQAVRFGYFELGYFDVQQYLQPAYVMPVTFVNANARGVMNSVFVAPAATRPVGHLMPPRKPPVAQEPRAV